MAALSMVWMLTLGMTFPASAVSAGARALGAKDRPAADSPSHAIVWVSSGDEHASAKGAHPRVFLHKLGEDEQADAATAEPGNIQAGGPWLGIQFGPVSKPLASQLKIESGVGQMVINVAENSPADTAGLQQYDVITQIDGHDVSAKIDEFMDKVRAFNPNESHTFTILRGAQQTQTTITVGARPADFHSLKYKYESPMEDLAGGKVFGRGGLLEKDPQGNWIFKGFNMKDMPDFFQAMPDVGDMDFQFNIPVPGPDGQGNQVFVYKNKGETLKIKKEEDGKITVTRTVVDNGKSNTTTTTYANEDELKAKDAAAYESLNSAPEMIGPQGWPKGAKMFGMVMPPDPNGGPWQDLARQYRSAFAGRKARTSFETTPDGKIRVTTRQGEDELVENFNNADELKTAKPDLYKKYERIQRRTASKDAAR